MNIQTKAIPEADLIQQLTGIRQALTEERQRLMERVATIDDALGVVPSKPQPKATKAASTTSKGPSIKDGVLVALTGTALPMKEIQALLSEHSPKSVETVVHGLVSSGLATKDNSSPKRFSLVPAK